MAEWVRALACTGDRAVRDGFEFHCDCGQFRFGTLAIPFTPLCQCLLTRFNKIATQGAPQMAVDKEANSLSRVYSYYSKFNLCLFYV